MKPYFRSHFIACLFVNFCCRPHAGSYGAMGSSGLAAANFRFHPVRVYLIKKSFIFMWRWKRNSTIPNLRGKKTEARCWCNKSCRVMLALGHSFVFLFPYRFVTSRLWEGIWSPAARPLCLPEHIVVDFIPSPLLHREGEVNKERRGDGIKSPTISYFLYS
jgi:hypothetical protein